MKFDLIKLTDEHVTRPRISMPRKPSFYPSEASVQYIDSYGIARTIGGCMRASYLRISGEAAESTIPTTPYSEWIFSLGKSVERILVEHWKQMGIWVDNNVEFYDAKRGISGEIDAIVSDPSGPGSLIGLEVKSFYGYQATKEICGNKSTKAKPKDSQLLQTIIYVDQFSDYVDYFKMIYYARDSASRNQFDINLIEEAQDNGTVLHRPTIDGKVDKRFALEDIYKRYEILQEHLDAKQLPVVDYQLVWETEKVEQMKKIGEVAKTTYEKWKKNPKKYPIGDWMCRYCRYMNFCWKN